MIQSHVQGIILVVSVFHALLPFYICVEFYPFLCTIIWHWFYYPLNNHTKKIPSLGPPRKICTYWYCFLFVFFPILLILVLSTFIYFHSYLIKTTFWNLIHCVFSFEFLDITFSHDQIFKLIFFPKWLHTKMDQKW